MAYIVSPSNPAATLEVDATPKAARVILYDAAGNALTMALQGNSNSSWAPDPSNITGTPVPVNVDVSGNLETRSTILTDEGMLQECFDGVSISTNLSGSVTVINGNTSVTGSSTAFKTELKKGQYIKLSAHAESAYTQIESIISDTALTLISGYAGAGGTTAAVVSDWGTYTGTGSITISSSNVVITTGVGAGSSTYIYRRNDYQPLQLVVMASYTQGVGSGQYAFIGFQDNPASVTQQACIIFDTALQPNQLWLLTSNTASAVEMRKTLCTLPQGYTVNQLLAYRISQTHMYLTLDVGNPTSNSSFTWITIGNVVSHLPGPYTVMSIAAGVSVTATVTTSAVLTLDVLYTNDADRVEIAMSFPNNPLTVISSPNLTSGVEDMTGKTRGSSTVPQLGATFQNYTIQRVKVAIGDVGEDRGDASDLGRGLPIEDRNVRFLNEVIMLETRRLDIATNRTRQFERECPYAFSRTGRDGRN